MAGVRASRQLTLLVVLITAVCVVPIWSSG